MHGEGLFIQAVVYLSAAVIAVPIATRLGLGSVLGYLLAGVIIGPFGLELIGREGQDVMHFAEFGVVMMLFLVGLELQPSLLWRLRGPILGMGGLQVAGTALIGWAVGLAVGLPWQSALAVGMILALSSTAIVLQTLNEKALLKTQAGQSCFSVLLFQDIAVIPMLALLPLMAVPALVGTAGASAASGESSTWVGGLPAWGRTLAVLGVVAGLILAGHFLVRPMLRAIAATRLREVFTATALLLVIGIALVMVKIGLSPALGTFLAGVVLADSEYRHELEGDIEPFKGLLLGLFFIAVGASIDFRLVATQPGLIIGLVAALIAVKFAVVFVIGRVFKLGLDQNLLLAFALAQGGEFAFVLFSFAAQQRVLSPEVTAPLVAVVALSMALTPLVMLVNERLLLPRIGTRELEDREADTIDEENPVIIAGFGRFGSVVGRLLRANGIRPTVLEYDSDHVELLRKLGLKVFYGDASRHDLLHAAGAERAKLLVIAVDAPEKTLEIVEMARKYFPGLKIFARAVGRPHAYELLERGVERVYIDTLDTALRVGVDTLRDLGLPGHHVHRAARTFRDHDEEALAELARVRHDKHAYVSRARERIRDLEQSLLAELEAADHRLDEAWDTTTMRREFGGAAPK
ncbi:MAG: monovalent cation:proton antiporter-2 (CPA2) family protein [bacterium]